MLSNILLNELDKELEKRGHRYVRYADDFSIYVRSKPAAKRIGNSIYKFLRDKLRLPINREKSGIWKPLTFQVMGSGFVPTYKKGEKAKCQLVAEALLKSIPGMGNKTAIMLIVLTDGFSNFENARQLCSYTGITPTLRESGTSVRGRSRITKMGNAKLKNLLFMCSFSASKHNKACREIYERFISKGKVRNWHLSRCATNYSNRHSQLQNQVYLMRKILSLN